MLTRTLAPLIYLLITACGNQPLATGPAGKFLVTAKCTPTTLGETVAETDDATLILAFESNNKDVITATNAANRATRPFVIVIGDTPGDKEELADAVIVADTGAATAIDLALLACNGVTPPAKPIEVGSHTITPANRAAGGTSHAGPGNAFMAITRIQHSKLLTTKPETDESHQIGLLLTSASDSEQERIRHEATAAASRYPQLQLAVTSGTAESNVAEQAQLMITEGCKVLLLATSNPQHAQAVGTVTAKAPNGGIPIIVLDPLIGDHGTCVIGCSPRSLGQAAAQLVRGLLPEGGAIITCFTPDNLQPISAVSESRAFSFCQAMNLPTKQLLGR